MFKKIIVTNFKSNGELAVKATLMLRKPIVANDYSQAKRLVQNAILYQVVSKKTFTVEWQRNGFPEGYMVSKR